MNLVLEEKGAGVREIHNVWGVDEALALFPPRVVRAVEHRAHHPSRWAQEPGSRDRVCRHHTLVAPSSRDASVTAAWSCRGSGQAMAGDGAARAVVILVSVHLHGLGCE